jgi:diamine N-acetyltransferase
MALSVYLRPLVVEDANISYIWRKDPNIWVYTEHKFNPNISQQEEAERLLHKLSLPNDVRFAICLKDTNQYIGNVKLIDGDNHKGTFYIFIGEKQFWGKGIGLEASKLILQYAFIDMKLNSVYLFVHENNLAAISISNKLGFVTVSKENKQIKMVLTKHMFIKE